MGGETVQREGKPALAHRRTYQSDINGFIFQNRPLFDMQLVAGVDREGAGRAFAAIANGVQRFAYGNAIPVARAWAYASLNCPVQTPEESIAGAKRAPSSLVQFTSTISRSVSI